MLSSRFQDGFLAVLDGDELPGFTKAESDQPATFTVFRAPSMKGEILIPRSKFT